MGFFSKKYCDICGEKISLIGNKKLDDGNMCKTCAKKLSPWFSDRRKTSLQDINEQLKYREDNKSKVSTFNVTRTLGSSPKVLIDDKDNQFMIAYDDNYLAENPDVMDISDVINCVLDIDENKTEIMRIDEDGREVSHMVRRYDYSYNFNVIINVNNPYFTEIKFKLNSFNVDGNSRREFEDYKVMGEEICAALSGAQSRAQTNDTRTNASTVPAFCPNCGAPTQGVEAKFCGSCGKPLNG